MEEPLKIIFDNLDHSQAVESKIREKCQKLERFYHHITDMQAIVSLEQKHHQKGNEYKVAITVNVPGKRLVVSKSPGDHKRHENLEPTINDAFNAMERQLENYARQQRGEVKHHDLPLQGRVHNILPDEGYGFITLSDGREIYFHRNSVIGDGFDALKETTPVRIVLDVEESEKGPQATTVEMLGEMAYVDEADRTGRGH